MSVPYSADSKNTMTGQTFKRITERIRVAPADCGNHLESAILPICHSKTQNLQEITSKADILVSAVGMANFVTADMVKEGAVVIDVGMNHDEEGNLCGDVKFDEVEPKAGYITPVPGGVGPMTIAMLMKNTLLFQLNR